MAEYETVQQDIQPEVISDGANRHKTQPGAAIGGRSSSPPLVSTVRSLPSR